MSVMLRASGANFDVDAFVATSVWAFANTYRRDEPRPRRASGQVFAESGFTVVVSEADFHSFAEQIQDAIDFLTTHRPEMQRLAATPGVDITLDFGIALRNTVTLSDRFPGRLVRLAGEHGVALELSHYPISD